MGYHRGECGLGKRITRTEAEELRRVTGGHRIVVKSVYAIEMPAKEELSRYFEPRDPFEWTSVYLYYEVIGTLDQKKSIKAKSKAAEIAIMQRQEVPA